MAKLKRYMAFNFGIDSGVAMGGAFDGKTLELEPMLRFKNRGTMMLDVRYWDFPAMLIHAKQGLAAYSARHGQHLDGLACSSWGADFGLLDKNGHLLSNPVHHLDKRTAGMVERLANVFPDRSLYQRTGVKSKPELSLYQLYAMALANSPLLDKAVTVLLMADLVSYFLTGTPVQEYTLATTTGMYEAESRDWSRDIILGAKIPPGMVPEIVAPGTVIGPLLDSVMAECGIAQTAVIAPASSGVAGAMAAVPAAAEADGWLSVISGYWNQVAVELANPIINDATYGAGFSNLGGVDGSIFLQKEVFGLGILDECLKAWSREDGREIEMADVFAGAEAVPALQRFINPGDPRVAAAGDKTAVLNELLAEAGQPAAGSRAEMARAYLDSTVLALKHAVTQVSELTGKKYGVLHLIGRASAHAFLAQALADATGMVVKAGPVDAKAIGNIVMQMIALGDVGSLAEARELVKASFPVGEFVPQDVAKWQEAYEKIAGKY